MIIRTGGFEAKNLKPKGHEVNCMPDIKLQFFCKLQGICKTFSSNCRHDENCVLYRFLCQNGENDGSNG